VSDGQEVLSDPVTAADGIAYEFWLLDENIDENREIRHTKTLEPRRAAIEAWFAHRKSGRRSPMTNEPLPTTAVYPNAPLKRAIEECMANIKSWQMEPGSWFFNVLLQMPEHRLNIDCTETARHIRREEDRLKEKTEMLRQIERRRLFWTVSDCFWTVFGLIVLFTD
jgi:hypothetical protein